MLQRQLSEIKNFQKPLHELTLTELFATDGCGETRPAPAGLAYQEGWSFLTLLDLWHSAIECRPAAFNSRTP